MAHSWSVTGGVKRNDGHSSDENFRPNANYTDDNRSGDYWHAATFPFIPDTVIPCGRSPYTSPYGATNRYNNTDGRTSAHCNREDTHRTGLDTESCAQRSMVDRPIRVFTCARGYTFREAIRESRIWNVGWKRRFGRLVLNPLTLPALLGRERFKRFLNEGGKKLPSFVKYSKYRFGHRLPPVEWKNLSVNSILCSIESNPSFFFFFFFVERESSLKYLFSFPLSLSTMKRTKRSPSSVSYYVPCVLRSTSRYHSTKCISKRIEICITRIHGYWKATSVSYAWHVATKGLTYRDQSSNECNSLSRKNIVQHRTGIFFKMLTLLKSLSFFDKISISDRNWLKSALDKKMFYDS